MSIVDEINKDLEKMGGDTSGHTVEEAMDKFGDQIIKEIGDATELPEVTTEDEGDVLMVDSEGKWAKGEIPSQLPEVTSEDEGDVLTVDSEGNWGKGEIPTPEPELPEVAVADNGKVLTVAEGTWEKVAPEISVFASGMIPPSGNVTIPLKVTSSNPQMYLLIATDYNTSEACVYLVLCDGSNVLLVNINVATDITVSKTNGMPASVTITNGWTEGHPVKYRMIRLN